MKLEAYNKLVVLASSLAIIGLQSICAQPLIDFHLQALSKTHSVTAPAWGPYSKRYAGISHIADSSTGTRLDVSVVTGFYKGRVIVPNVKYQSDFYPWHASKDLENYAFREEIVWKDKVYSDISFKKLSDDARQMTIELVNKTDEKQGLSVNIMVGLQYENTPVKVQMPQGRSWISAINYSTLAYKKQRADDNLRADGLLKGEVRNSQFTGGSGLGDNFGSEAGDKVGYTINNPSAIKDGCLLIRYRIAQNAKASLLASGLTNQTIELVGTGNLVEQQINIGTVKAGVSELAFTAQTNTAIELDGFCLIEKSEADSVKFIAYSKQPKPLVERTIGKQGILLKYENLPKYYGICWDAEVGNDIREILTDEYDNAIKGATDFINENNYSVKKDTYTSNIWLRSFTINPQTSKKINAILCVGTKAEVLLQMQLYLKNNIAQLNQEQPIEQENINTEGKPYLFSQQIMKATMLQNIVYPLYTQQEIIKQFVPGKRWNSLYTWDGGFIGLGMLDVDIQRAVEALNGYVNAPNTANAYIHHGSPVPVQFLIYQELWNRTQSKELLQYFYERLRNYYLFYTGQWGSSTTGKLKSGLLNTFDYFYNSGGWDDYPAQSFARNKKMYNTVAPVISTSMAIRIAKLMQVAATTLGIEADRNIYQKDIDKFSKAIQQYSWDEDAGYFGYVKHDSVSLLSTGILRTDKGVNYNMGLDGVYPLVAGICTQNQKSKILAHLFSPKHCWTNFGITAIDQSAPYYSEDGYWNGTVWFPHQFILWKTMLGIGEGVRANEIASTALKVYKKEVDSTYNSLELIRLSTGHSSGWHQFSGLSAPVLNWFAAYYKPGSLNVGYDAWVMKKVFNEDNTKLNAQIKFTGTEKNNGVLVCMNSYKKFKLTINGKPQNFDEFVPGTLSFNVSAKQNELVNIEITPQ